MAYEQPQGIPTRNEVDKTGETEIIDGRPVAMKPSVAKAVRGLRERMPKVRPTGIFHHPSDWEQEELDFIADCLKQNIPIYTIANMVHCERHTLSKVIERTPELRQLREDKYENLLDEAEYQADRLMKAGNSSLVMYVLQTLGRKRGWVSEDEVGNGEKEESKIVMGIIPEGEVRAAEAKVEEARAEIAKEGGRVKLPDPMTMALVEDAVKEEVNRRIDKEKNIVEAEGRTLTHPYREDTISDAIDRQNTSEYGAMFGTEGDPVDDPWSDGASSMFCQ